jgi:hypothetical protein
MKTKTTLLILTAAAGWFGATALAADGATNEPPRRLHRAPPADAAELKAYHEKVLAAYDVDKNGAIDEDERAVHRDHVRAGTFPAPPFAGQHRRQHPHRKGPPPELVAQYDLNRDGTLDETEHAQLRADIQSGKIQPPHRKQRAPRATPPDGSSGS